MKRIFLIIFLCLSTLSCFATQDFNVVLPLKGQTQTDKLLQKDVLNILIPFVKVTNPNCQKFNLNYTKLIHPVKEGKVVDGKLIQGYWRESWSVNACGKEINYPILFTCDGVGGTYFNIELKKKTQY